MGVVLKDGTAVCTGSLIAADLVLTAAHCAEGFGPGADPGRLRFRTGAYPGLVPLELPAARIVFATDYPQEVRKREPVRDFVNDIRKLGKPGEAILSGNVNKLLKNR